MGLVSAWPGHGGVRLGSREPRDQSQAAKLSEEILELTRCRGGFRVPAGTVVVIDYLDKPRCAVHAVWPRRGARDGQAHLAVTVASDEPSGLWLSSELLVGPAVGSRRIEPLALEHRRPRGPPNVAIGRPCLEIGAP